MEIRIPAPAEEIINKLNERGFEAYVVGGCVRDMLLGREPGDWDITTSALPVQVKSVFRRTVDTGIQHGTVTVLIGKEGYEVTTYRIDGEYSDGRHPNSVCFTPDLTEDLKRRDFTINAMAYNSRTGFVDVFGGVEDLNRKIIRCVGNPIDRFTEDALRILRAIRFSAQLGFEIEENTYKAIQVIAPNMVHVSKERIQVELTKLLCSAHPEHIKLVYDTGISPYVTDGFHMAYGAVNVDEIPSIPTSIPAKKHLRWAAFLRKCSSGMAAGILKDLKLDNDTINKVRTLVQWLGKPLTAEKPDLRRIMSTMDDGLFDDLLTVKLCLAEAFEDGKEIRKGQPQNYKSQPEICSAQPDVPADTVEALLFIKGLTEEIRHDGDCIRMKNLAVSGNDVIKAGVKPGKEVGDVLAELFDLVLEDPEENAKERLLARVKERLTSMRPASEQPV